LSAKKKLSKAQLAAHPILTHARETDLFKTIAEHFGDIHSQERRLVPSSNLAACLHMAINHMGVATLPKAMVRESVARKQIIELMYEWNPESLEFRARYDAKKSASYVAHIAKLAQQISGAYGY